MHIFFKIVLSASLVLTSQELVLRNGGYEDLHVIIQDDQVENEELVERIKDIFTQASSLLFTASRHQVFFRKIKVIIPRTWTKNVEYTNVPALSLRRGYITVGAGYTDTPHVRGVSSCGTEGDYMYLSPTFILKEGFTPWGNHANVIVHEWGHFRWGIFDEYAYTNRNQSNFYATPSGWKPVTCTEHVTGRAYSLKQDTVCDTKDLKGSTLKDCGFAADVDQSVNASLMGHAYIKSLTMFCDNGNSIHDSQRHNRKAPNNQNIRCQSQSAWEVMRKHTDFSEGTGTLPQSTDTTPVFELLQETSSTRVFVFDVSGSMQADDKLAILVQTATHAIQDLLPLNSSLGIVIFNSAAQIAKEITEIRSQADRDALTSALSFVASGGTCIGCGVIKGIELLTSKLGSPENGEIILVSDGETNDDDKQNAIQAAQNAKVTVNTVVVTQDADTLLEEIATLTGGVHVPYLGIGTISFVSAFAETIAEGVTSVMGRHLTLISERIDSALEDNIKFQFTIDEGAGMDTTVTILARIEQEMSILLTGPYNYTHNVTVTGNTAKVILPKAAKPGKYDVLVLGQFQGQGVDYVVQCYPTDSQPIRIDTKLSITTVDFETGELPVVYALVNKGFSPVLNASVEARIEVGNKSCTIQLKDNGQDPDVVMNDGTYAGVVLPNCLGQGRVAVKVYARGGEGTAKVTNNIPGASSLDDSYSEKPLGSFERVAISNNLLVKNYSDPGSVDTVSPGRITDVRLYGITSRSTATGESRNFSIIWTATGDDQSTGQAFAYQLRISNDFEVLLNNFDGAANLEFVNGTVKPKMSGNTEAVRIEVDAEQSYTESAFFALRAVDDAGNVGPVSNIVQIVVAKGFRVKASNILTLTNDQEKTEDARDENTNGQTVLIIAFGASVAGAVLVVLAVVSCYLIRRRRQRK